MNGIPTSTATPAAGGGHVQSGMPPGVGFSVAPTPGVLAVLTPGCLALLADLHRRFESRRQTLLQGRRDRQMALDAGELPDFLPGHEERWRAEWRIGGVPADLTDRRVEITGPVNRKMIINALNAPVQTFMADFEDSCAPTWDNIIEGHRNLRDAVDRTIEFGQAGGKVYRLREDPAVLIVRPRGWHLPERHLLVDGQPISASLFDFGVFLFHNAQELCRRGSGPYFYLPKLESHREARLWNDVFLAAQSTLGLSAGTIKATVLIETILAAFEMDEILFELRDHIVGLNCGRWDYIFSYIKKFRNRPDFLLPDRSLVGMDKPFLKAYVELLIRTCHRRGAHAIGGMAAQIPIRGDDAANDAAMARVRADKLREARAGHDGTWIAHPGLAPIAREAFDEVFSGPNQLDRARDDVQVTAADLLRVPEGPITEEGMRHNIRVGIQYLEAWLGGNGCVPLYNLMEDAATAEISRAQLWQWLRHRAVLADGRRIDGPLFDRIHAEELERVHAEVGEQRFANGHFPLAAGLFSGMVRQQELDDFLTLPAYQYLS